VQRRTRAESLAPRVSADSLAAEREILESWIPADTTRPVLSAIRSAFIEHFSVLYVLLAEKTRNPLREEMPSGLVEMDKDCTKLAGLLFSRSKFGPHKTGASPRSSSSCCVVFSATGRAVR
jgi:hypothetical protein